MPALSVKSHFVLVPLAAAALLGFALVEHSQKLRPHAAQAQLIEATERSQKSARFLRQAMTQEGWVADPVNDPARTLLIGHRSSPITSGSGSLDAKSISMHPAFAALVTADLLKLEIAPGDVVAVGASGSFPALNISVLAALDTLGLEPMMVSSVAASGWGATDPEFTWLDMERRLHTEGLISTRSLAASMGAGEDHGRGLSPRGRRLALAAIERNDIPLILEDSLAASVERRLRILDQHRDSRPILAFINIGGSVASLGRRLPGQQIPAGLSTSFPTEAWEIPGMAVHFARRGVPVLNLSNILQMSRRHGLTADTVSFAGSPYMTRGYDLRLTMAVLLLLSGIILALYLMERRRHQLGASLPAEPANPRPRRWPAVLARFSRFARLGRARHGNIALLLVLSATGTDAAWVELTPPDLDSVEVATASVASAATTRPQRLRTYYLLPAGETLELDFVGPGRLQLLTRALLTSSGTRSNADDVSYQLIYRVDRGERQVVQLSTGQSSPSNFVASELGVPGQLRKHDIEVGPGWHSLRLRHGSPRGAAVALRLRMAAADEAESAAPDQAPSPWSYRVRFAGTYDSNILRYSEKFLERFQDGTDSGRFRIASLDDYVARTDIRMARRLLSFGGRPAELRLDLQHNAFARNDIKDWSRIQLSWQQQLTPRSNLNLSAFWLPDFYIRHLRDSDFTASEPGADPFSAFALSRRGVAASFEHRWSKTWRGQFALQASQSDHGSRFPEFDSTDLRASWRLDQRWSKDLRWSYRYRFQTSDAQGFDQPGETRATSDDSDPSYDQHALMLGLHWRAPNWRGRRSTWVAQFEASDRRYTTDKAPAASPLYAGRQDELLRFYVAWQVAVKEHLDVASFFQWRQRSSSSAISPINLDREKSYDQYEIGLRLSYSVAR